jgi:hypothetical protein
MRSARGVARTALQIDLQLLELGDVLIDALLPFLAQRFPHLRRYRMDIRQNGQLLGDFLEAEALGGLRYNVWAPATVSDADRQP